MSYPALFIKQPMMRKMGLALAPVLLWAWVQFGARVWILLLVCNAAALLTEYVGLRAIDKKKTRISEAVFITGTLYTLVLPPDVPFWVAILGIIFGMLFGKMVFGGFGRNIFNPALLGRCFVFISFPSYMTGRWTQPFTGFPGGILQWSNAADAITSATPLSTFAGTGQTDAWLPLFFGRTAGSMGEMNALLILLAAIYLIATKTASYRIIISTIGSFLVLQTALYLTGTVGLSPVNALFSGGFLFGAVYMATDPVSAPKTQLGKVLFGLLIGTITVIIRHFGNFTEGIMFAILIANAFASLIDVKCRTFTNKTKAVAHE